VTRWARILELADSLEDWAMEYTAGSELGTVRRQASELHELLADPLDATWAEAEAALPEGRRIYRLERNITDDGWEVWAGVPDPPPADVDFGYGVGAGDGGWGPCYASGPTLAAALRALAEGLREARP
jgi:hypothetical protein